MGYDRALLIRLLEKNLDLIDLIDIIEAVNKHAFVEDLYAIRTLCYICGQSSH